MPTPRPGQARLGNGLFAWHADAAGTVTGGPGGEPNLAAGPWATGRPATLDPSYWSLTAFQDMARLTGNQEWHRLAAGALTVVSKLTRNGQALPPDWAELTPSGAIRPEPSGASCLRAIAGAEAGRLLHQATTQQRSQAEPICLERHDRRFRGS